MENIEVGEIFTIYDENEAEQEVEVLGAINLEGTVYVAVSFVADLHEETEDDIDLFFLKIDQDGDLAAMESDAEFDKVSTAFWEIMTDTDA